MDIAQKYRIIWKNEYSDDNDDILTHKKRYLFLLKMVLSSVNKKDYEYYDDPREIPEYIEFAKNTYMQDFDYDRCFLNLDFQFTKEYKKLIANQFLENSHRPKQKLRSFTLILSSISFVALVFGITIHLNQQTTISFFLFCISIACLISAITLKLYCKGIIKWTWLVYLIDMPVTTFLENLEEEMNIVENSSKSTTTSIRKTENDSLLQKNKTYKTISEILPKLKESILFLINNDFLYYDGSFLRRNPDTFPEYCINLFAHEESITGTNFKRIHKYFKELFNYPDINKISVPGTSSRTTWYAILPLLQNNLSSKHDS